MVADSPVGFQRPASDVVDVGESQPDQSEVYAFERQCRRAIIADRLRIHESGPSERDASLVVALSSTHRSLR